jgi:chorismate lyase/3-hydroxybenzoate synthase
MEKTQTRDSRYGASDHRIGNLKPVATTSLALAYLNPDELAAYISRHSGHILGIAGFGRRPSELPNARSPQIWVDMPVLGDDSVFEVWRSSTPVTHTQADGIDSTRNAELIYGCFEAPQGADESIEAATFRAYTKLFDCINNAGYPHLWRVWHYFPRITAAENGGERYHAFNVGRHEAFLARGRMIGEQTAPAACALGSRSGHLVIYFMAGKHAGVPIENPRQTSAYHYPEQYGPRSPTFARAMLVGTGPDQQLLISGTASIVGHATQHAGDVAEQTRETLANIRELIAQAKQVGFDATWESRVLLKVYLRRPDDLPLVRAQITEEFGTRQQTIYLQADVCRTDLLLEIEGVCDKLHSSSDLIKAIP